MQVGSVDHLDDFLGLAFLRSLEQLTLAPGAAVTAVAKRRRATAKMMGFILI
jgi:hypothetical protein